MAQEVIRALGSVPPDPCPRDHDAAISEGALLQDLIVGPACGIEFGNDEFAAGISF